MARGPFQGTHSAGVRPTIVTAPDALVYINGNSEAVGCPQCKKRFPFNKYITSISVDLSVESAPGSASINLAVPRHAIDDFFFDGEAIVSPMMEIEIFSKGYFLVEGLPQYYPIFWGLVTEVTDDYSGGEHTVSIHCEDILKWWQLCQMAVNSAFTSPAPGARGMSLMGNVFFGENPYDMIWTLAQQSFGDVVVGTGSLVNFVPESGTNKATFTAALKDLMLYWNERFTRMRSNLLLYGTNGVAVRGDTLSATYNAGRKKNLDLKNLASRAVSLANGGADAGQMVFDPTDPGVVAFKTVFQVNVSFWQSDYQPKLELATACKEAIGFEFFMDVDGSIVFKPPFYNLDVLANKPVSWIQDIDIIDWNWSKSEEPVITQIQMSGSFNGNTDYGLGEETTPATTVTDYHLLRQYGWRTKTVNSEFLGDPQQMFYHGMDILDRTNAKRQRGSVTIPHRPELRLGFPVYVAPKDQMWYVQGISHNIQMGGRATTQLTLTAKRGKFIAPQGIGTMTLRGFTGKAGAVTAAAPTPKISSRQIQKSGHFDVVFDEPASMPPTNPPTPGSPSPYDPMVLRHPKTGRIVGYPNAVMVYTRPVKTSSNIVQKNAGNSTKPPVVNKANEQAYFNRQKQSLGAFDKSLNFGNDVKLRERYITNRFSYGLTSAGAFVYARDASRVVQEITLLPANNLTITAKTGTVEAPKHASAMIRPVSDDRGFEVIGHFRYGRGVSLRDGRLIQRDGQPNDAAKVDTQVALAGDLFAMLTAQSQGLTSVTSGYGNPAELLANLSPDDRQTAGYINPDTKEPVWQDNDDNFVRTATLGTPEQKGVERSVEATQLSRALTLAEMTVTDTSADDLDCPCLVGRSDLAFMNTGYNVKTINTTIQDASSLSGASLFDPGTGANSAASFKNQPLPLVENTNSGTREETLGKIDTFLLNLYQALDGPHQAYEAQLRGENLPQDAITAEDRRFGTATDTNLAPPFGPAGRAALGDPRAIAQQADSASSDIAKKWEAFGSDLKKNAKKAELNTKISQEQANLKKAIAQRDQLMKSQHTPAEDDVAKAIGGKSYNESLAALNQRIADLEMDLHNDQTSLNQIG
ncbi:hypothetical protein OAA67_04305 [Winogradskyella sp.]|nr:hypothetical protein [Winogradskyella sp.]